MASSIALTRSLTLMNLLSPSAAAPISVALMKLLSPRLDAAFSVHSFSTAIPRTNGSDSSSNSALGIPPNGSDSISSSKSDNESIGEVSQLPKQFMKKGSSSIPYKVMKDKEAMYAKWDIPGVGIEGLKLRVEDNSLHVNGEEEEEENGSPLAGDECRRKYYLNIDIPQGCYKVEEIAAELRNGVLKVKIPKRVYNINIAPYYVSGKKNVGPSCSTIDLFDVLPFLVIVPLGLKAVYG